VALSRLADTHILEQFGSVGLFGGQFRYSAAILSARRNLASLWLNSHGLRGSSDTGAIVVQPAAWLQKGHVRGTSPAVEV
jgi:hypothetical protein